MSEREPSSLVTDPVDDATALGRGSADRRSSGSSAGVETAAGQRRGARSTRERRGAAPGSWFRRIAAALLALQLLTLLAASAYQFSHYEPGFDFATYAQAWWLIGHGRLDPYSTTLAAPFLDNQAQLLLWPLALLEPLFPSGLTLLWLEDAAIVATNALALVWVEHVVDERRTVPARRRTVVRSLALLSVVLSPWCYETALFPFHVEPFVGLFAIAAGLAAWTGRTRWLWVAVPLLFACGVVGLLAAAGLGLALVVGPGTGRRAGALVLLCAAAWLAGVSTLGLVGGGATIFSSSVGYLHLPNGHRLTAVALALHVLTHLGAALSVLGSHLPTLAIFLLPAGLLGIATRWGGAMALALLVPPALLSGMMSLDLALAAQIWPALPFVVVGSTMVLLSALAPKGAQQARAAQVAPPTRLGSPSVGLLGRSVLVAWLTILVAVGLEVILGIVGPALFSVPGSTAARLQSIAERIPTGAEVVVTPGEVGRFALRPAVASTLYPGQSIRITRPVVVFVLVRNSFIRAQGFRTSPDSLFEEEIRQRLHARLTSSSAGVTTFLWDPGRSGGELGFPSATYRTPAAASRRPGGHASRRG